MYSRCVYICPFYRARDKLFVRCEGGELKFHDGEATSDYVAKFCADDRWGGCSIASALLRYYERQESDDEKIRRDQTAKA